MTELLEKNNLNTIKVMHEKLTASILNSEILRVFSFRWGSRQRCSLFSASTQQIVWRPSKRNCPIPPLLQKLKSIKSKCRKLSRGLERWLCGYEHLLLLQRPWVWFPAPTLWLETIRSCNFKGCDTCIRCTYVHVSKTFIHINNK